jgi:hypothetical protein
MLNRPFLARTGLCLFTAFATVAALGLTSRDARAADPVPIEQAEADVTMLMAQVKDDKKGNEDLIGSIGAIQAEFFNIAPPAGEAPAALADGATPEAVQAHAAAQKKYDDDVKKWQERVKTWQGDALDVLFKALRVVEYNPKQKENSRNDVNLKAALALGEILGSPDLAKFRDEKEVAKLRGENARKLQDVITNDFGKPKGNREYSVPVGVLEATFAAIGKTNDPRSLEWLAKEYVHTRNGQFEEERLVAAHKAMKVFTNVPGKQRYAIVGEMIKIYSGTEASAGNQSSGSTAAEKSKAQAAKAFWDKIKSGVVEAVNYYATAPGGGPPVNTEGQGYTTLTELRRWWQEHERPNRPPWVDPPKELKGASTAAPPKDAPK